MFPKVRVADVLAIDANPIYGEPLTFEEKRYALMAHFDFVIADKALEPQFAVEFDGKWHKTDLKQIERDRKKNSICDKAILPLLRVGSGSLRKLGHWQLLEWLTELWFVARSLRDEDEDEDEVAERRMEYGLGPEDDGLDYQHTGQFRMGLHSFSYLDPFGSARREIAEFHWERLDWRPLTIGIEGWIEETEDGPKTGYIAVPIDSSCGLLGRGRCDLREFAPWVDVLPEKLAQDLAIADAAAQLRQYRQGNLVPLSNREIAHRTSGAKRMLLTSVPHPDKRELRNIIFRRALARGDDPLAVTLALDDDPSFDEDEDY